MSLLFRTSAPQFVEVVIAWVPDIKTELYVVELVGNASYATCAADVTVAVGDRAQAQWKGRTLLITQLISKAPTGTSS